MTRMGVGRIGWALAGAFLVVCSLGPPRRARADGDDDLGPTLYERAIGLRVASAGVGLAGRISAGPASSTTPVEEGTITLAGIPAGAEIRHAYLYWMTYGEEPDTEVALDGEAVTGALIGTGGHTCWSTNAAYDLSTAPNRTYRADVTARVDGDGDYVVSGVASGERARDAQGASLVVVYVDPGETLLGTVIIRDGTLMVSEELSSGDFDFDVVEEVTPVAGELHLGVGDGQTTGLDGTVSFGGRALSPTLAGLSMHYNGHSGNYWDANVYDLTPELLVRINDSLSVFNNFQNDCLAYAYGVLAFRTDEPAPPDAGVDAAGVDGGTMIDAGGTDGGGLDAGASDAGMLDAGTLDGGTLDGGARPDGGAIVGTTGGCGCNATAPTGSMGAVLAALGISLALRRRSRRSRARSGVGVGALLAVLVSATWASVARADGDGDLGPTLYERAIGLRVASAGVGLAGRISAGAASTTAPVEEGTITLAGIPAGAEIRHAYLYWMTYGEEPDTEVALDGEAVTGELIGSAGHTCWFSVAAFDLSTSPNRTYRADVTALVDGDGDYVVSGVASGEFARDAQGASLVVVYVDRAETLLGTVALRDGAVLVSAEAGTAVVDFDEIEAVTAVSGQLHVGVGDGQTTGVDGTVALRGRALAPALAGLTAHYTGHDGNYWDANVYDLSDRLTDIRPGVGFSNTFQNDCLAYAYVLLAYQSDEPAPPDAGVDAAVLDGGMTVDAGGTDGGGLDAGASDAGGSDVGALDVGALDAGARPDTGVIVGTTGGCGCRATSPRGSLAVIGVALVAVVLGRRRR